MSIVALADYRRPFERVPNQASDCQNDTDECQNATKPGTAQVKQFSPRLLICSVCGSHNHRAASCPRRPRRNQADENSGG